MLLTAAFLVVSLTERVMFRQELNTRTDVRDIVLLVAIGMYVGRALGLLR